MKNPWIALRKGLLLSVQIVIYIYIVYMYLYISRMQACNHKTGKSPCLRQHGAGWDPWLCDTADCCVANWLRHSAWFHTTKWCGFSFTMAAAHKLCRWWSKSMLFNWTVYALGCARVAQTSKQSARRKKQCGGTSAPEWWYYSFMTFPRLVIS